MFKVIQIQVKKGAFPACFSGQIHEFGQISFATHSVKQPGQEVCIGQLFDALLIFFLFRYFMDGTEQCGFTIHPGNIRIVQLIPLFSDIIMNFFSAHGRSHSDIFLKNVCKLIFQQFLMEFLTQTSVGKNNLPGFSFADINGRPDVIQHHFQGGIRPCKGILLYTSGNNTLQNSGSIIDELQFIYSPDSFHPFFPEYSIHTDSAVDPDGNYHHGLHTLLFHLFQISLLYLLCMGRNRKQLFCLQIDGANLFSLFFKGGLCTFRTPFGRHIHIRRLIFLQLADHTVAKAQLGTAFLQDLLHDHFNSLIRIQ